VASTKATLGQIAVLGCWRCVAPARPLHGHALLTHVAAHIDSLLAPNYLDRVRVLAERLPVPRTLCDWPGYQLPGWRWKRRSKFRK